MAAEAPTTLDDFVDLLRRSGLVDRSRFEAYWGKLQAEPKPPDRPHRLARRMVEDGLLTTFQVEQLLKGKFKGFELGNYRILERIGRGGMGSVYLAEHARMKHRVAIKVLPPEHAENPTMLERFYREARSAAVLSHPNLMRAHDIDQQGSVHFLVMEYIEGVTLHDLVTRRGPLTVERAAHYMGQAAVGLQYAHQAAGMVHRDIKPGNLLVDRSGTVKILDMGLARLNRSEIFDENQENITKRFNDKSILGTADYIAPEQAVNSQSADTRADLYSLGGTFYFCLTGQPPFPTGSVTQKLVWHQMREPTAVRELRAEVPEAIAQLVRRMMAKKPEDRPQHPGEVVEALMRWIETPIPPPAEDEIPKMCLAAQGPASGGAASCVLSSINLGALAARAVRGGSETSLPAAPTNNEAAQAVQQPTQPALSNGTEPIEVPAVALPVEPTPAAPAPVERTPAPRKKQSRAKVWLTAAAVLLLAGVAATVWRWQATASESPRPAKKGPSAVSHKH
jgi:tRNA A-37 threonylcarbamoyl transferase component Bud32